MDCCIVHASRAKTEVNQFGICKQPLKNTWKKKSEPARNEGVSFYLLPLFSSAFVYLCVPKQSTSGADMNNSCKMIWVPMYLCSKQSQKNMNEHLQLLSPCWVCIIKFHNQKNWNNYIKHAEKNEGRNF